MKGVNNFFNFFYFFTNLKLQRAIQEPVLEAYQIHAQKQKIPHNKLQIKS